MWNKNQEEINDLRLELDKAHEEIDFLVNKLKNDQERNYEKSKNLAEQLRGIIGMDVTWYDYEELSAGEWQSYYAEVKTILESKAFQNEVNHVISTLLKLAMTDNKTNDPQVLRDCRMMILSLTKFVTHLEEIKPYVVRLESTTEDLHNPI